MEILASYEALNKQQDIVGLSILINYHISFYIVHYFTVAITKAR